MEKEQWKVCLCGRLTVEIDGRPITPEGRQGRLLFAYLAANRSRALRRDELIDVVWASKPTSNPDRDLNVLMARLRRQFGADVLPKGDVSLRLPETAWLDLEVIAENAQLTLQALEEGRPDEAAILADDALALMEDEFLTGSEGDWIEERRRELAELRLLVSEASLRASLQLGGVRLRRAKGMAEGLVAEAPYRESGHELLMRVHAASGNLAEASRVYHRMRILLRDELGTAPGPSITELNERVLRGEEVSDGAMPARGRAPPPLASGEPAARVSLPPPLESVPDEQFVGRDDALARLQARWDKVSFRPRAVALTGEPGIGKTRLAACFSRQVHRADATVLYGRCDEDPLTSYQPFVEALDHYMGVCDLQRELPRETEELGRRVPRLGRRLGAADSSDRPATLEDRYALFEAIVAVFRRAAEARPLLLVIDDIHWADAPTFSLMLYVVRSLTPSRCMFLMTSRDEKTRPDKRSDSSAESIESRLAALRREAEVERIGLEGLDEHDTAKLIWARHGSAPSDIFARDLTGRTGGNPFFIGEALRSLAERKGLDDHREADLQRLGVPEGVREVITRRLDRLGSSTSKVLARASVIGPQFTLSLLAAISDLSADVVLDELEELIANGLVVEVPHKRDHFAFSHALIREVQYGRLISSRRARVHSQVALELESRLDRTPEGEDRVLPAELAHHFYEGRPAVDPQRAAHYSIEAAKHARRGGAYEEAITHYGRALELLDGPSADEAQLCELLLSLGKVELRAGRLDEARQTFGRAAEIARRTRAVDRLALAALGFHGMYTPAGEVDRRRIELLEEARAALGPADSPLRARVLARLADSLLWLAPDRALELSGEAVAMARRLGDMDAVREALGGRHAALLSAEHLEERLLVSRERLVLAAEAGNREAEAEAVRWYMNDLCERGDVRAAKEQYARLTELARELRQPQYSSYVSHWACVFAQLHGRLDEAERLADEGYELAKRAGARDAEMSRLTKRVSIYREQGRVSELRPAVERVAADIPTLQGWRALGALIDAETGNSKRARAQLDRLVADGAAPIPHDVVWLYGVAALAETSALLEDTGDAAAVVYPLLLPYADHCVHVGMVAFWGSASRFLGLAATACGHWDRAENHYSVAEKQNEKIGSAPLVARTLVDHADMLLRRGGRADGDAASRLLAQATGLAEPLGMVEVCRRAARLRARAESTAALA